MLSDKIKVYQRISELTDEKIIKVERMLNSYSNIVYKVETASNKYIYKEYNELIYDEQMIITKLKLPKILVLENDYRIEEYIEYCAVDYKNDLLDIVKAMKNLNKIQVQGIRKLDELLNRFKDNIDVIFLKLSQLNKNYSSQIQNKILLYPSISHIQDKLTDITKKILEILNKPKYLEGLCHNDLHLNNMLKANDGIILIDFEYSSMGDVLYDIANLFCESRFDYNNFLVDHTIGYSAEEEKIFVQEYFKNDLGCCEDVSCLSDVELDKIMMRIQEYKNVSHFLWFLWSIPLIKENLNDNFKHDMYALSRLSELKRNDFISEEEYVVLRDLTTIFN